MKGGGAYRAPQADGVGRGFKGRAQRTLWKWVTETPYKQSHKF